MRLLKYPAWALLLLVCLFALRLTWFARTAINLHLDAESQVLDFSIESGQSLRDIAQHLREAGFDFSPAEFTLLVRLLKQSGRIQAGSYEVQPGITPLALIDKLTRGDVSQASLLFVEGMSFAQLRKALDGAKDLHHDSQGLSDQDILLAIGATETHPEGLFFPDTYFYAKRSSDLKVLKRAYQEMQKYLQAAWKERAAGLPLANPYEALILASIVEKETGQAADREQVAGVFINRLKIGMRLQTDPTVIYGMGLRFDGNLRKRDLQTDSPYNTYLRAGLPPTPIAMPGAAAIQAALHPAISDKLYFVARGDGSSEFSRNLHEHNRAVAKYQKNQRRK